MRQQPPPPTGVSPFWNGSNIALSWLTTPRAQTYSVYRATSPSGEGTTPIASGLTGITYTDTIEQFTKHWDFTPEELEWIMGRGISEVLNWPIEG